MRTKSHDWRPAEFVLLGCLCVFLKPAALLAPAAEPAANLRPQVEAAIARMRPALVRLHVVSTEFSEGREIKMQAVGSGAIITKDGYLITNHHVAGHATRIFCTLWNREEIEAELVGTDPLTDIAIVRLKPATNRVFTAAVFGDSSKLKVGDYVLAMGSPMALSQSVTLGIISNVEMTMPRFLGPLRRLKMDGEDVGSLVRWIGHDAAIYGGNSGGPLVNLQGEIVGINEISMGLGGAIPVNLAKNVAAAIMAHGKIERSWLGVDVQPVFKHSKDERGVLISGVVRDSPAARAGLQAGDRLLRLNDTAVNVQYDEQMPEFMRLTMSLPVGKPVSAVVRRDSREMTVELTPAARGELLPKEVELKPWGITARNLSSLLAIELKRRNQEGVLVTSVRPGGPAGEAKPSVDPRDVIVEVNGTPIKDLAALSELTAKLVHGQTEPVPVVATFERKADRFLSVVKLGQRELRDPGLEVTKAWLPIEAQVISRDIARQSGQPNLKGFYVSRVYPDSTAEKAGLKLGDFITAVDDTKLTASAAEHDEELTTLIRQYDIGQTVELTVLRNTTPLKIPVTLAQSPRLRREMKKYRNDDFEFTVRDVSFFDIAEEQWDRQQRGALVEEVKPGGWAELGSLYTGDLILQVDGQPVKDVDSMKTLMTKVVAQKKKTVILEVLRGIHTVYLELEPNWKN